MKKFKSFLLLIVIATIYAFTSVNTFEIETSNCYKICDIATDFKLKNIDDTFVSLSDFPKAKGFIIIFTCNTCPVSKRNEDIILALDKKYKDLGYPVIAINPNNPAVQPGDIFALMKVRAKEK